MSSVRCIDHKVCEIKDCPHYAGHDYDDRAFEGGCAGFCQVVGNFVYCTSE